MRYILSLLLLAITTYASAFFSDKNDFLPVEQAFSLELVEQSQDMVMLQWRITPGHYLYRHSIKAQTVNNVTLTLDMPSGIESNDEHFGKIQVYRNTLQVPVALTHSQPISVTWQGCADAGLCYPPQISVLQLNAAKANGDNPGEIAQDQGIAQKLANASLLANLAAFFIMGILLAFTPCMLPMLPILSTVIAGSRPGGWQGARLGLAFVVPMALVYAILGIVAAKLGSNINAALQNPWFLIPFASLFVVLALAQFGAFTLQLPTAVRSFLQKKDQKFRGGSLLGAASLGVFSALLVGPCMTAPLAGALLYIGQSGDVATGALALFSLGIGSGLPLLLAMSFGMRWLPKPGQWMQAVNRVFAYALLAAAIFIVRPVLDESLILALWAALILAVALQLMLVQINRGRFITRYLGLLLTIYSSIIFLGAATGGNAILRPLAHLSQPIKAAASTPMATRNDDPAFIYQQLKQARQNQQWVLVDFYADWCVSCKAMEKTVFGKPEVQEAIADILFLQPDVTQNNAAQQALLKEFAVMGPPTILFIAPDGQEVRSARITGEVNDKEFLTQLEMAQRQGN